MSKSTSQNIRAERSECSETSRYERAANGTWLLQSFQAAGNGELLHVIRSWLHTHHILRQTPNPLHGQLLTQHTAPFKHTRRLSDRPTYCSVVARVFWTVARVFWAVSKYFRYTKIVHLYVTPDHKTSHRYHGYIRSNSQQYIVWVKMINFSWCKKSLGY